MTRSLRSEGPRWWRLRTPVVALAALLVLAGCGDGDPDDGADATATPVETPSATPSTTDSPTEPDDGDTTSPDEPTPTPTDAASSPDDADGDGDGLPGVPWDGFAAAGDVMMVVGVAWDDVLNVRAVPGTEGEIVATASPTATDLVATGRARQLDRSLWYEVTTDGVTGWASVRFLAFQGPVDDYTSTYLADHDRPSAETMLELGTIVAEDLASTDDPVSRIVNSVAPTVGDLGEVVMDVVGIGDDSVLGFRLHVFATPDDSGEGFTLRTIEMWTFCARGVTSDTGICV